MKEYARKELEMVEPDGPEREEEKLTPEEENLASEESTENAEQFSPSSDSPSEESTEPAVLEPTEAIPPIAAEAVDESLAKQPKPIPVVAGKYLVFDLLLCVFWAAASDFLVFQHGTFLAWALQFCFAMLVFAFAKRGWQATPTTLGFAALLVLLVLKLIWCGSWLQVGCGCLLFAALAMSMSRVTPFFPELLAFFAYCLQGIITRIRGVRFSGIDKATGAIGPAFVPQVTLPFGAVVLFSTLFVLANPDLAQQFSAWIESGWNSVSTYLGSLSPGQAVFWFYSIAVLLGFLYPAAMKLIPEKTPTELLGEKENAPLYSAYRNTLLCVILLFARYLVFEFATLGFRDFPEDFYYAGYAHQGAFWLTVALAVATGVLSAIFQGQTLADPRLGQLKRLAIAWSALNFLLSIAVFNRLMIYVNYNGLTQLRVVGFLGITCVVLGFTLVLWKLLKGKGAIWLLHRQSWVPVLAVVAYAILPVDWFVQYYNTQQVLRGNLAPSTQIAAKLASAEGVLPLFEIIDHPRPEIRDGVRAIMAIWAQKLDVPAADTNGRANSDEPSGGDSAIWTSTLGHSSAWATVRVEDVTKGDGSPLESFFAWQGSEEMLRTALIENREKWSMYRSSSLKRLEAINSFYRWAYRWY